MKTSIKVLFPALIVPMLIAIFLFYKNDTPATTTSTNSIDNQDTASVDKSVVSSPLKQLSILSNRCRGCGKCVRIDPEHFEMSGRTATVISSRNLSSSTLQIAINNCHDRAISLN